MDLYWIIGLALLVLIEKVLPMGPRLSNAIGALFLIWGEAFVFSALVGHNPYSLVRVAPPQHGNVQG